MHTTIYKIDKQQGLYSTGNYTQYLVITDNGKEPEKEYIYIYINIIYIFRYIYIYITESLWGTPETNTTL